MIEREDVRLWFSMIGTVGGVPAFVLVIWAIWFVWFDLAPPTMLVTAPRGSSGLVQAKATIPPPSAAKPVAPPLAAQTLKPLSTTPTAGDAHAYADPTQPGLAQAEAPAPPLRQQPTEVVLAPPDAKASEVASAPPTVAPPMAGEVPAYPNPAQPVLAQAEAPAPPPRQQPTEVVLAPPDAKASEVASAPPTVAPPMVGEVPAYPNPVQPVLAQVEATARQLRQQPTEGVAAPPDARASKVASAPPTVALPIASDAPAYPNPVQDISTVVSSVMPAQPAALKPSEPIEGPIPLPRPKPRVIAHVSRTVLARSPVAATSRRPSSHHAAKSVNATERDRFP